MSVDPDKVSDIAVDIVMCRGVEVTSRYGKIDELRAMTRALGLLDTALVKAIASIWCNSKATASYEVKLKLSHKKLKLSHKVGEVAIANALGEAFIAVDDGHNGIWVGDFCVDPSWPEEENRSDSVLF